MNPEIFKILYFVTWIRNHFGEGSQKDAVSASGFAGFIGTERRLSRARKIRGFKVTFLVRGKIVCKKMSLHLIKSLKCNYH